ncbi:MAG: type II toxin-antitoxin system RelE/ParE family toxin [Polyangiales bacterium]
MRTVRYELEAAEEFAGAVGWYEDEVPGLGTALLEEVEGVLEGLRRGTSVSLRVAEVNDPAVRRVSLSRFPYSVVYIEHGEEVRIVAIAHHKRRPGYWTDRLR